MNEAGFHLHQCFFFLAFFWAVFCRVKREYERVSLYNR